MRKTTNELENELDKKEQEICYRISGKYYYERIIIFIF